LDERWLKLPDIDSPEALNPVDKNTVIDRQRKLPNMNEFSPGVLGNNNIKHLLETLSPYNGNKELMISKIASNYTRIARTPPSQRNNRANNVLIGMSQCGLLIKQGDLITGQFSQLANEILECEDDFLANARFAKHLLEECSGLELLDVVEVIRARGEAVNLQSIRDELRSRGFTVTENESNASKIRMWIESTGAVDQNWKIDNSKLYVLIGATSSVLARWHSLPRNQRIFLEQVKYIEPYHSGDWITVRQLKRLSELAYGRNVFPEGRLRMSVLDPLVKDGWIKTKGTGGGRGGDSGEIQPLNQLLDLKIKLPIDGMTAIPVDLRDKLAIPINKIFEDLKSEDRHIKGVALELLALRLTSDIGLFPVCFRERSAKTQGAEVDVIANGVNLHYSRWLIQCKNTPQVHVHDIAKEVGMAVVLKAQVITLVTTGQIGRSVRTYADGLSSSSSLQAVLIDGELLNKYKSSGASVVIDWLRGNAYRVLTLKQPQVQQYDE
jgi:site-specific DNA-methyltransferase (cytosine-N4-specific)